MLGVDVCSLGYIWIFFAPSATFSIFNQWSWPNLSSNLQMKMPIHLPRWRIFFLIRKVYLFVKVPLFIIVMKIHGRLIGVALATFFLSGEFFVCALVLDLLQKKKKKNWGEVCCNGEHWLFRFMLSCYTCRNLIMWMHLPLLFFMKFDKHWCSVNSPCFWLIHSK